MRKCTDTQTHRRVEYSHSKATHMSALILKLNSTRNAIMQHGGGGEGTRGPRETESLGEKGRLVSLLIQHRLQPLRARPADDQGCLVPLPAGPSQWGCVTGSEGLQAHGHFPSSPNFPSSLLIHKPNNSLILLTGKAVGNTWQPIPSALYNRAGLQLTELLGENRGSLTTLPPPHPHPSQLAHAFSFSSRQVVGFH